MFRKLQLYSVLALAIVSLSGCDFLRRAAQRPTSEDIAAFRDSLAEARQCSHEAEERNLEPVDTPDIAETAVDSVAVADTVQVQADTVQVEEIEKLYYAVIGTFSQKENADRMISKCMAAGLSYTVLVRNNVYFICLCPSSDSEKSFEMATSLAPAYSFFPKDIWVIREK